MKTSPDQTTGDTQHRKMVNVAGLSITLPKDGEASKVWACLRTVAQLAEPVEDFSEALVHGRQRLQLDLLEVLGTIVLQVTVPFADAAHDSWRLEQKHPAI